MKAIFIEARKKVEINEEKIRIISKLLPLTVGLITTVQYTHLLNKVKNILEKNGRKVFISKGKLMKYPGQIIGCDIGAAKNIEKDVEAFLFIGSGEFHIEPLILLGKNVFVYSLEENKLKEIDKKEAVNIANRKKAALMKVLAADCVGIIVSVKPGQQNLKSALLLKKKLEKIGKKTFVFITDNIRSEDLENFKCGAWINTSCQALNMEPKILNICDLKL